MDFASQTDVATSFEVLRESRKNHDLHLSFTLPGRGNLDAASFIKLACEIIGGLGIFLLGMKHMSDGMQAVAGNSLRRMIGAVTNHRILATTVGVIVTTVVQSSSVTTVMVIGFVNSGVMQLGQAIGVIMGANIGTTITGWILVLKIGKYGLPLLGASSFVYLFSKGDRWRYWAMALMGVGAGLAQFLLIATLEHAPASLLARFTYIQLISSTIFGIIVFGDFPDSCVTIGAVILVSSGIYAMPRANPGERGPAS